MSKFINTLNFWRLNRYVIAKGDKTFMINLKSKFGNKFIISKIIDLN